MRNILEKVNNVIADRKAEAEELAYKNEEFMMDKPEYIDSLNKIGKLNYEIAMKEYNKEDSSQLKLELKKAEKNREKVLSDCNMTKAMLKPNYYCKKCNDTGYINGKECDCFKQLYKQFSTGMSEETFANVPLLEDLDADFYPGEGTKLAINYLREMLLKFDTTGITNIILYGLSGTGKTYVMKSFAKSLINKNYNVLYMPAYKLNEYFIQMTMSDMEERQKMIKQLFDVDILMIDDLGTEQRYKNITIENLNILIDERVERKKKIMITTNLTDKELAKIYDIRICSRLFFKDRSLVACFDNPDLRRKK